MTKPRLDQDMINQCSSCGGFCKKSGCERENVKPTPQRTWVGLTDEDIWEAYMESPVELDCSTDKLYALSRTVEAKLKQKNGYTEEKNTRGQE